MNDNFIKHSIFFRKILANDQIIDYSSDSYQGFAKEWRGNFVSTPKLILLPRSSTQASQIISYCYEHKLSVVPQSGNTGLVGGSVAKDGQIIISTQLMNNIIDVNVSNYSVTLEAGVVLNDLNHCLKQYNLFFPLALPSGDKCCLGGNIATNAGGMAVLKYGDMRNLVLGLEAILPDGSCYSDLNLLRKRNIGTNLVNLFVGSEGVLGLITKAVLKIYPLPSAYINLLIGLTDITMINKLFHNINHYLGFCVSAFELFNNNAYRYVKQIIDIEVSIDASVSWFILIRLDNTLSDPQFNELIVKKLHALMIDLDISSKHYFITDQQSIWDIRLNIPKAQVVHGVSLKHDIAIPLGQIAHFILHTTQLLSEAYGNQITPVIFGHLGDGNLHFNISTDSNIDLLAFKSQIKQLIVNNVMQYGGTFSAEHGIGLIHKGEYAHFYAQQRSLLMLIKSKLDHNNYFNTNKIFDIEE